MKLSAKRSSRLRAASSSFDRGMIELRCPKGCCSTRVETLVQFTLILGRTDTIVTRSIREIRDTIRDPFDP